MGKEFSQKTIRRILREETQIPISVMRRLKLNRMPDMMKSYSLREFKGMTKELIIQTAALRSAKELLPWHDERGIDYDDDEYQRWVNLLTEYFIETYGNETLKYFEKVLPSGSFDYDGNRYTFIKHSEYIGGNGFSESYFTWADLMETRGWWFPIDWWDVKDKLDKIDDGRVTFLRPGEPHNTMGYYFSIYKKKINLEESVIKILRENDTKSKRLENYQKLIDKCINNIKYTCENLNSESDEYVSFETCKLIDADVKVKLKDIRIDFGAKQFVIDITYDNFRYIDEDSFVMDLHLELKKWIKHNSISVDEYKNTGNKQW